MGYFLTPTRWLNPTASTRQHVILLLLLGTVFIGSGIGLRDPWPSDEPRFALIARDMVASGDWFFPRRGGELYPDKPPLYMWSQAVVYAATGSLRVAFLLPSLLAGLVILLVVYDAGCRLWRKEVGLAAAFLLLVSPQFVLEARAGQIDALVSMWVALGVYGFLRHLLCGPSLRWYYLGFAACGLGIITKGVGFLPLLVFLPWLFVRRRYRRRNDMRMWPHAIAGPAVMLSVIALWLVPMLWLVASADDAAFTAYRDNILFQQTGQRYISPSHHFKPWWYLLGPSGMLSLWLPWTLLLPWLVPAWARRFQRVDARYVLLLAWVTLVLLFFSLSPAKRAVYILPALPWACLAAAPVGLRLVHLKSARTLALVVVSSIALGFLGIGSYLTWMKSNNVEALIERYQFDPIVGIWWAAIAIATLAAILRRQHAFWAYAGSMLVLWLTIGLWVYPNLDRAKSGRALMLAVEAALPANAPLALVNWKEQTLLQAKRPTVTFGFLVPAERQFEQAVRWIQDLPDGYILLSETEIFHCLINRKLIYVGNAHRRHWYLAGRDAVRADCSAEARAVIEAGKDLAVVGYLGALFSEAKMSYAPESVLSARSYGDTGFVARGGMVPLVRCS